MCEPRSLFFAQEWASNYEKFQGKELNLVKQMQTMSKHIFSLYSKPLTVQNDQQKFERESSPHPSAAKIIHCMM
jgi:hypothetical protein